MTRRARRVTIAVVVLLLVGAGVLVFVGHSRLDDSASKVDRAWTPLRAPLAARYLQLAALETAFRDGGGAGRAVAGDLQRQLERWTSLQQAHDVDAAAEVEAANALEGSARRLIAVIDKSDRLRGVEALTAAKAQFQGAVVPDDPVRRYNKTVDDYQKARDDALWSPAATIFGYDSRPALSLAT